MFAYFCGEFVNSFVLAKMKVATEGKYMGARFVSSTVAGEAVDSALFYPLAFYNSGIMPNELVITLVFSQFITKTLVEIAFLPITYRVVAFLKRAENEDHYDRNTDFNPFKLELEMREPGDLGRGAGLFERERESLRELEVSAVPPASRTRRRRSQARSV